MHTYLISGLIVLAIGFALNLSAQNKCVLMLANFIAIAGATVAFWAFATMQVMG